MKLPIVIGLILISLLVVWLLVYNNAEDIAQPKVPQKVLATNTQKKETIALDPIVPSGDTFWLNVSAAKIYPVIFSISGKLKKGDLPFESGVFVNKNDFLAALDMTNYFKEVSKLKLLIRDELLDLIGSNSKLQEPEAFIKWNGFIKDIDISKKLPEFPAIYNLEEEQILRNSQIGSNYVKCRQLEQNTQKFFLLNKNEGFIWDVKKNVGDEVKANESIMSIVRREDLVFSGTDDDASNSITKSYDLFNSKGQKIGILSSLKGSKSKFKLDKIAIKSLSIDLKGQFYILNDQLN